MAAAAEVQALLRFLTKEARIPLADALPKINDLRKSQLNNVENISKADLSCLVPIFPDEKTAKVVINAAKRVSNPRKRGASSTTSPNKRLKGEADQGENVDPEATLALPQSDASLEELQAVVIETNRAPLFLAFAVTVLKYTHPEQPLSSRLSLAQAVVSANSQTKAKSIGLTNGPTAEQDGWAQGQPKCTVLGREIAVMRRTLPVHTYEKDSQDTLKQEDGSVSHHEAFWGIDLEALRKSNGPLLAGPHRSAATSGPPIHRPEAARGYLLRSIVPAQGPEPQPGEDIVKPTANKKKASAAEIAAKKEQAVGMLLKAIELVCESWAHGLTKEELGRRGSAWYSTVRPEIEPGQAGWGQRGKVKLSNILRLRKLAS